MTGFSLRRAVGFGAVSVLLALVGVSVVGQTKPWPWLGHSNNPQHTANSLNASQNMKQIFWKAPVDINPKYSGSSLLIHYGSPVCTAANNLMIPVKVGTDGFRVDARRGSNGTLKWQMSTDYRMPPHNWGVPMGITLTPRTVMYMPGAGGTLHYRTQADSLTGASGRVVFYGAANYNANPAAYNQYLFVNTPLTSDANGNIYFGFWATGDTPLHLKSGIARVTRAGVGTWVAAEDAAQDTGITKVVTNCAPALSNDQTTVYVAVHSGNWTGGYLLGLDATTLQPKYKVRLKDAKNVNNDAFLTDDGTSTPMVGPDGDVYYGVLENSFGSNHYRGWMLHFDETLATKKAPGAFGWDNTASVIPIDQVSPAAGSPYYIMTKYNHYASTGGDGVNKIAILDPNTTMTDPVTGATVMKEVMIQAGPTPDPEFIDTHPNAVREWCINTAAYDPFKKCVFANCEDGKIYRWNITTNQLDQVITLTQGIGEAYTPTMIGADGRIYAINNATLFCIGEKRVQ